MKKVHEMTPEERCRHYESYLGQLQHKIAFDDRVPRELYRELSDEISEVRGIPF